ncbi:MAG TPA: class I SAM-dependent methyltransferase [Burkholderiales bacterium]|nr:class I SAM-dependent methyltransferase [Burkholderiales bacterium]
MRADKASSTAALIAASTVFLSRDPALADFVPAGAAEICARCLTKRQLLATRVRWLCWSAERATIPGLMLHFMLRKRWIEQALRGAIMRGCRRVVVIGAGYDTLAARLAPVFPAVRFMEVDHPATQAVKRAAVPASANLEFIAADLARVPLGRVLSASREPSVYLAEGLLMYLAATDVDALFAALDGEIIFTTMEPAPGGRIAFHNATWLERALLGLWQEPFTWGLARTALGDFLAARGLRLREYADLAQANPELLLARGELVVHATRVA